ncbi:hypothetical protein R1sor_004708 [Riccia sorocarpa]|uniref:Uncharacterized protein n=1 Tax=Riccia sorocarpa TaxID=122646 RepID=A0ABD3HKE2_9MARC
MVEYCEQDHEPQNPPAAEEVGIETLDPPPVAEEEVEVAKSPLRVPLEPLAEEVSIPVDEDSPILEDSPTLEDSPALDSENQTAIAPEAEEVQVEIMDAIPGDCCETDPKKKLMAKGTKAYCLSCRKKTTMFRPRLVKMKKGQRLAGSCKNCSTKTSLIISKNHQFSVK